METHHQADVIEPAEREGVLEYRLGPGVHLADLKDLGSGEEGENPIRIKGLRTETILKLSNSFIRI